jgi:ureidoacrylate peracid hydrolase
MTWRDRIPQRVTELAEQIAVVQTALVLVDLQNDFVHDDGIFVKQWGKTNHWIKPILPVCRRLLLAARAAGVTVVHLRVINDLLRNPASWHHFWGPPSCVLEGTWGAEFVEELRPAEDEVVVTKYTYDGFLDTPLDSLLKKLAVRTLVFAGVDSDVCVRDTAAHGFALGYTPVFARDALAADNEVAHAGVLQSFGEHYGHVVSANEIIAVWQDAGPRS